MAVLDELLVRLGVDMSEAEDETERGSRGILDRLGGLEAAGGLAAAGLGAAFSAGLAEAMDATEATTKLQNQLGLTDAEAQRAGSVAGDVFSAGFGESIGGVTESLGAVAQNFGGLGKLGDKELTQLTKDAEALASTFDFDVSEAAQAAGTLMKAGLAKDGTQAFDLITAAAQKLPPAMREELPDLTKEYSEFFDQLGFTGPEMFGLLAQAAKDPTFELDKLGDAVKEFTLQIGNTSAVEEPLKKLGLNVKDIQKLVNTGHGTKAFDEVTTALKNVKDQTERTQLQAALFGGPGEDMGNSLLNLSASGAAAATGMDDAAGAAKKVTDNMQASPAQTMESIWRTMATTIGQFLQPALQFISDFFQKYPGLVQVLVPIVLALAAGLAIAAVAQWAMNSAMLAWPGTWIIAAILALVAIIVLAWQKSETFRSIVLGVWDAVRGGIETAIGQILTVVGWLSKIPGWISGWFGQAKDWAVRKALDLVTWLAGLPGRVGRAVSGLFDGIPNAFRGAINSVIGWWNRLHFTIGGGSIMGVSIPSVTLSTPDIPYLAKGGIATGPTLAMVGEGGQSEAIVPLSKLDQMINTPAPSVNKVQPLDVRITYVFEGADDAFADFLQKITRTKGGGSVAKLAGEA